VFKGSKCRKPTPFKFFSYQVVPAKKKTFHEFGRNAKHQNPSWGTISPETSEFEWTFSEKKKNEVPHLRMTWGS
jgi:hypothetical protein